jgi:hypothetical protein
MSHMLRRQVPVCATALLLLNALASDAVAQQSRTFVARLSTVPLTVAMQDTVAGRGSAKAVLTGNKLTVEGTFEGLRSPATVARIHLAPRAMRGPAVLDLMVSAKGTGGTLSGSLELTPRQLEALEKSSLYIQLHSEKAPDGNLWGWLLPQGATR